MIGEEGKKECEEYSSLLEANTFLKSLKKRVEEGQVVVMTTDKTETFAVLGRERYLEAGQSHTQGILLALGRYADWVKYLWATIQISWMSPQTYLRRIVQWRT